MKEVIELLTENYLVKQGIMRPSHEVIKDGGLGGDIEARNLLSNQTSASSGPSPSDDRAAVY